MTSSVSTNSVHTQPSRPVFQSYVVPTVAAFGAFIPQFYQIMALSVQNGLPTLRVGAHMLFIGLNGSVGLGVLTRNQMLLQGLFEQTLAKTFPQTFPEGSSSAKAMLLLASSAVVGGLSTPFLAVYYGKTMVPLFTGRESPSIRESLSLLTIKRAGAVTLQETGFVAGLAMIDLLSGEMKQEFGNYKVVEYSAAAIAGGLGSLVGRVCDTALNRWHRWQTSTALDDILQTKWGAWRRVRGNIVFALMYKLGNDILFCSQER